MADRTVAREQSPVLELDLTGRTTRSAGTDVASQARSFLAQRQREEPVPLGTHLRRCHDVAEQVRETETWTPTTEELEHALRLAWRNADRCIGRIYWQSIVVRDRRHLTTPAQVFAALVEHLEVATNGGDVRPVATVLAPATPTSPGVRIWNSQLLRYAGYRSPDGTIVGDPANVELTERLLALGWPGGPGTPFDLLPLAIETPGHPVEWFELPAHVCLEVPLSHPDLPFLAGMGLRWPAVPAIADMALELGGVRFTAVPFNGWYLGTEVGARNLADEDRYDLLPAVARGMGLDTSSDRTLWKDRAHVELNVAVIHSFDAAGVRLSDHHAESRLFLQHVAREERRGRTVAADWSWIVPPLAGSTTPVFHRYYDTAVPDGPRLVQQAPAWAAPQEAAGGCPFAAAAASAGSHG